MKLPAVQARRGIALVITLIMLAVVTLTAVVFLGVSSRERSSVVASSEQIDARYAADAALSRVKAELASAMVVSSNRFAYGLMVSTNYQNPLFNPNLPSAADFTPGSTNGFNYLTNVNAYKDPKTLTAFNLPADNVAYRKMLANLYYDPRAPVFYPTNRNAKLPTEFRYYLDLNRNGRAETNGWVVPSDANGRTNGFLPEFMVGDPEWISVLENADAPHSGTNRFIYRYAYLVVPAGRTLGVNHLHNAAKKDNQKPDFTAFSRNQGVGAWEMNLAGFLTDLNTNVWRTNDYFFDSARNVAAKGVAFQDANRILAARRLDATTTDRVPSSARDFFRAETGNLADNSAQARFLNSPVDYYSDGPFLTKIADLRNPPAGNDQPNLAWAGGDYTNAFTDFNQLFDSSLDPTLTFAKKLTGQFAPQTSTRSSYDNYTFYRLLAQLGTDSVDARFESGFDPSQITPQKPTGVFYRRAKLNLNFKQADPNGGLAANASVAGFADWTAINWFTNAAHRLLLTEFTNGLPYSLPDVDPDLGVGLAIQGSTRYRQFRNSPILVTNHTYSAQAHRLLQLAANIYDYSTNRVTRTKYPYLPSVFQPVLYRADYQNDIARFPKRVRPQDDLTRLGGFVEVTNATRFLQLPWVDLEDPDFNVRFAPGFGTGKIRVAAGQPVVDSVKSVVPLARYVGVPLVIGAKKGYPNFNEGFWQAALQVTRRLFVLKTRGGNTPALALSETPFIGGNGKGVTTEAQYRFDLHTDVAAELFNSYTNAFPRELTVVATNVMSFGLYRRLPNGASNLVVGTNYNIRGTNYAIAANAWKGGVGGQSAEQFRTPIKDLLTYSFVYDHINNRRYLAGETNRGRVSLVAIPPILDLYVTNRFFYALVDKANNAIVDYVSFKSVIGETNVLRFLAEDGQSSASANLPGVRAGAGATVLMPAFWRTNQLAVGGTIGISNQMAVSLGRLKVAQNLWRSARGLPADNLERAKAINGLYYYLYHTFPTGDAELQLPAEDLKQVKADYGSVTLTNLQVGFNPSPTVYLTERRQANDPLVHYTFEDLQPGYGLFCDSGNYSELLTPEGRLNSLHDGFQLTTESVADLTGLPLGQKLGRHGVVAYAPWGMDPQLQLQAKAAGTGLNTAYDLAYKDPFIRSSDDWAFPTNAQTKFANIGQLGRVHRGTPWQTVYLKSSVADQGPLMNRVKAQKTWGAWSGSQATHPVNDWKIMDLFTTAVNDNAARGLMSVNQTNVASWSALLAGVPLLSNGQAVNDPKPFLIRPDSAELKAVLGGYTDKAGQRIPGLLQWLNPSNSLGHGFTQLLAPGGYFTNLGSVLSVPTLSDHSPLLSFPAGWGATSTNLTDEVIERVPQQVLSLLRADEPRVVVYSFGQSLKPAQNSLVTAPGRFYGLCTNYQVTGEFSTKTTLRFDGPPNDLKAVVEDYRTLFPSN